MSLAWFLLLDDLNEVAHPDLVCVVDDELVVLKTTAESESSVEPEEATSSWSWLCLLVLVVRVVDDRSMRNLYAFRMNQSLCIAWATPADTVNAVVWVLQILNVLGLLQLLHVAKSDVAEQKQRRVLASLVSTIRVHETLAEHVSEVHALAEHVASGWSLWRCDPESLRENTDEVEHRATVVQEPAVADVLVVVDPVSLALSQDLEQLDSVSCKVDVAFVRVLNVLNDSFVLWLRLW